MIRRWLVAGAVTADISAAAACAAMADIAILMLTMVEGVAAVDIP